jgi:6-pyruvoyltetrahydropterin/6-carboxytetrahydropterin synthase
MESFGVRIARDDLTFCASHFITLDAKRCERLHGHNYRVTTEVRGHVGDGQYIIDFLVLERLVRELIEPLDHRVLLPSQHPAIRVFESDTKVEVVWSDRRWVFPHSDCVVLPVANTTAESLAGHLGRRLIERLEGEVRFSPDAVRIELEEIDGHSAFFEWHRD